MIAYRMLADTLLGMAQCPVQFPLGRLPRIFSRGTERQLGTDDFI